MFYVYTLKSLKDFDLYIGSTNDIRKRVGEHNKGRVESTKGLKPLKLVYYETYLAEEDARNREKQLKLREQAKKHLKGRIANSLLQNHS